MSEKTKHDHKEAFCLMTYLCERCKKQDLIWNSRDGVTPFTKSCPSCGGTMVHTDWRKDVYSPDFIPASGQYVWIDMPESLKRPLARKMMLRSLDTFPVPEGAEEDTVTAIVSDFREREPWLIRWPG